MTKPILDVFGKPLKHVIHNDKGEPIVLNAIEQRQANSVQKYLVENELGAEIDVTTMTAIIKKVSTQKFYQIQPSLYLPIRVGEHAYASNIVTFREYQTGGAFEEGLINSGKSNDLNSTDVAVDAVTVKTFPWAKMNKWTLIELGQAMKAGNWDLIEAKERSRKRNYDLGIQKMMFMGNADLGIEGLLSLSGVNTNTTRITKFIKDMTAEELNTFCANILGDYRTNTQFTAWPTHFVLPEVDYLGLAAPSSADFPLKSKLQLLLETFRVMTGNPSFEILPLAYANKSIQGTSNIYCLYNYSDESLRADVPIPYTPTIANTTDGFEFKNVAYSQFTGAKAYREREFMYFTHNL